MTKEQLLETLGVMRDKLVEQGKGSLSTSGSCRYRGPEGTKCAIGHVLADEDYEESLENNTVTGLIERGDIKELNGVIITPYTSSSVLRVAQQIHDKAARIYYANLDSKLFTDFIIKEFNLLINEVQNDN